MTKEEIKKLQDDNDRLSALVLDLQAKLEARSNGGRKAQVLTVLKEHGPISVKDIGVKLGIKAKNVSSQLTYLREDGHVFWTDDEGRKFIPAG